MNELMRYDLDRATDKACAEMVPADGGQYVESNDFVVSPPSVPPTAAPKFSGSAD
jgi:hypothetical protein